MFSLDNGLELKSFSSMQFGDLSQRVGHQLGSWEASLGQEVDDLAANIGSGLDTMTDMVQVSLKLVLLQLWLIIMNGIS